MGRKKTSRREFLQRTAQLSASLPLLPLLHPMRAHAATGVAPLRLVLLWSPFQIPEPFYHPQASSTNTAQAPAGTSFYLNFPNSALAPLAPFQNDLLIFRGLKYAQGIDSHESQNTAFTGARVLTGNNGSTAGTSIDQYLFQRMGHSGSLTPFCAGAFSYFYGSENRLRGIAFNKGSSIAQIGNPLNLYNTLFGNFSSQGTSVEMAAASRRLQMLNLAKSYLNPLIGRVPASSVSAAVLQSHLAAVQGLSGQINASITGSQVSCTPPLKASITNDPGSDSGNYSSVNVANDFASFTKLITQSFACDITRFCSYKMSDEADPSQSIINQFPGLENFNQGTNFHDSITHRTTGTASAQVDLTMAAFKKYFMFQAANLLTSLKSVSDPYSPTQTLYDNTVVLIGSEGPIQTPGSNTHGQGDPKSDQPFIIAGGCGGYFKKGLLVAGNSKLANTNHNALLTNIINTFEKNQQQFNPNFVPNYITQYGDYPFSVSPTAWLSV